MNTLPTLEEKFKSIDLLAGHTSGPKNVVLVTVEDLTELFWQLAPYSMAKLDEARGVLPKDKGEES